MNGFKMSTIKADKDYYNCIKAEDVNNYCSYIELARIEKHDNDYKINLLKDVVFLWNTNLHLKTLTLIDEIKIFYERIQMLLSTPCDIVPEKFQSQKSENLKRNYVIHLSGNIALHINISEKHSLRLSIDDMLISSTNDDFSVENVMSVIAIDDADIFTFQGLKVHRIKDSKEIREERYNSDGFVLDWNKTWGVTINLFRYVINQIHFKYRKQQVQSIATRQSNFI